MLRIALVDEAPLKVEMIKVGLYCRFDFYLIKTICALLIKCTFKYFTTSFLSFLWMHCLSQKAFLFLHNLPRAELSGSKFTMSAFRTMFIS